MKVTKKNQTTNKAAEKVADNKTADNKTANQTTNKAAEKAAKREKMIAEKRAVLESCGLTEEQVEAALEKLFPPPTSGKREKVNRATFLAARSVADLLIADHNGEQIDWHAVTDRVQVFLSDRAAKDRPGATASAVADATAAKQINAAATDQLCQLIKKALGK